MRHLLKRLAIPLVLIAATLGLVLPAVAASAATTTPAHSVPLGFQVSPTRVVIPKSGNSHTIKALIINTSHGPITLHSSVIQLTQVKGKIAPQSKALPDSGTSWIHVSQPTVTLPSYLSRTTVLVHVNVPVHHSPGQRAVSVAWTTTRQAKVNGSGAVVQASIASPELLINTTGKVVSAPRYSLSAPTFSSGGPIGMHYDVNNHASNVYSLNNGQVVLNGHKTVSRIPGSLLLAGSSAGQQVTWQSPPTFGIDQHLTAYANGKAVAHATVWLILPLYPILGGLAVLGGAWLLWWRSRKHRAKVIARAVADSKLAEAKQ